MIELPEEVIRHIREFNADFHPNLLKCHTELLENKPIYYSRIDRTIWNEKDLKMILEYLASKEKIVKWIGGRGRTILTVRALEIGPERVIKRYDMVTLKCIREIKRRQITAYYGWGFEKDHESWKAVLKGEAGRKCLTTGYH